MEGEINREAERRGWGAVVGGRPPLEVEPDEPTAAEGLLLLFVKVDDDDACCCDDWWGWRSRFKALGRKLAALVAPNPSPRLEAFASGVFFRRGEVAGDFDLFFFFAL